MSDPLGMDAEAMRRAGYRVVDMLVEHLEDDSRPPLRRATPDEMRARIAGPPPDAPEELDGLLEILRRDVLPFASRGDHPGFFAFVPFAGTWPGALGDLIASAANVYAGSWMESAGPSRLELEVLDWFKDWVGYPAAAAGVLVNGGSGANLTGLACAREARAGAMSDLLVVYVSDQAHSSLARAARVLGFRPDQVRVLPTGPDLTLRPETLVSAVQADLEAGRIPLAVCATAGTTNSGAVDPLHGLADAAAAHGLWLHVDAAYGGFAVLTKRGRATLDGLARADSITLDPHKWLYQPYECGCILVRDGRALRRAFEIVPDYLRDSEAAEDEVNFADLGIQLTRSSRALKVWLSLRYFGLDAFRAAIDRTLDLAELAVRLVKESDELELAAPPSLGVVCLRRRFVTGTDEDAFTAGLVAALEETGRALVSTTRLHGRTAIRMCVLSHTSDEEHVRSTVEFLARAEPAAPRESYERHPDVSSGTTLPAEGRTVLELLDRNGALERSAAAGETVVRQWDTSRDFYVLLDGSAEVTIDGAPVTELGPGDFFGELAALDWGAGFGYSRLATIVARTPLRLLVIPSEQLNMQVRERPELGAAIRRAVHERLARRTP